MRQRPPSHKKEREMAAAASLWQASSEKCYRTEIMELVKVNVEKELPRVVKELEACAKYNCLSLREVHACKEKQKQASESTAVSHDGYAIGVGYIRFNNPFSHPDNSASYVPAFIDALMTQKELEGIRVSANRPRLIWPRVDPIFTVTFDWRPLSMVLATVISLPVG